MDRVLRPPVKSPATKQAASKKVEGTRFLFPAEEGWELWRSPTADRAEREGVFEPKQAEERMKVHSWLAIPMQQVTLFPLWLATLDRSVMKEMVQLQLERRGLTAGSKQGTTMSFRVIKQEAERSLLSVAVLSADFPDSLSLKKISSYALVADFNSWPLNQLILWKELGQQIVAFSCGKDLVYAQTFSGTQITTAVIQEITCTKLELESQQVIGALTGITAYGNYNRGELDVLSNYLNAPLSLQAPWQPTLPATKQLLLPPQVQYAQELVQKNRSFNRILTLCAVVYLFILFGFLGNYAFLLWQERKLQADLSQNRSQVASIRYTAQMWESMEQAIMPENYPVELLFQCALLLPEDGLRLITYDQAGGRILISGEAKSSAAAFKFLEDLKKSKGLAGYTWEMPPPKLLPNDSAQFQLEGKRIYALIKPE